MMLKTLHAFFIKLLDSRVLFPYWKWIYF